MRAITVAAAIALCATALSAQAPPQAPPPAPGLTGDAAITATIANLENTQMTVQALGQALRTLRART